MVLLSAVLVAAQALSLPAPSSRVCRAVDVADPGQERVRRQRVFSGRETGALELKVWLHPRLSGDHTVRLKLFTPHGHLYQEMEVPYSRVATRGRRGDRDDVRRVRRWRSFGRVKARLPVAGTSITLGSLYGRWTVVPYLDDDTAPCGRARRFTIER